MDDIDPAILAIFGPAPAGIDLTEENYTTYNAIACAFFSLSVLAVIVRIYVRVTRGTLALDDYTIVAAVFAAAGTLFMTLYAAKFGSGQHIWAVNISDFITTLKLVYAEPWVYAIAVTTTRVSILLLYHRLFDVESISSAVYVWQTRFAVALTALYPVIMFIVMAVACQPITFYWRQYMGDKEGTCIKITLFYLAFGVLNMINDIVILILPIPTIAKLQMNWKKKVSIMGIMLVGSFGCVSSMIRIHYLKQLAHEADVAWWLGPGFGWSCIEPSAAIITACLPTLAPLLHQPHQPASQKAYNHYYRSGSSGEPRNHRRSHNPQRGDPWDAEQGELWSQIEEDEVELTRNQTRPDSHTSVKTDPDMRHDGAITAVIGKSF